MDSRYVFNDINIFGMHFDHFIAWYAVILVGGLIAGAAVACFFAKRRGFKLDIIVDYLIIAIPLSVIGARLYYVLTEWDRYADNPISMLYVWEGGLAIYGAVIGAVIAAVIFCLWKKVNIGHILDFGGVGLIVGQAIGRWANFVNQEAFGTAVTNPDLQKFPIAVHIDSYHTVSVFDEGLGKMVQQVCEEPWHLATFFYESMWNILVFAVLFVLMLKVLKRPGNAFAVYLIGYGLGRSVIEGLRTDSLWLIPGVIRISQALSVVLVIGGILYLILIRKRPMPATYSGFYSLNYNKPETAEENDEIAEEVIEAIEAKENAEEVIEEQEEQEEQVVEEAKTEDTAQGEDLSHEETSDLKEDEVESSETEEEK